MEKTSPVRRPSRSTWVMSARMVPDARYSGSVVTLPMPPQETTLLNPVTAKEALADLEDRPRDEAFSHIWSEAKVSGEQGNRKLVADRPGYTMRAECHGNIQFHYSLPRRISMREAARIQSCPDTFVFPTGLRATERQIGNAVPPVLAWHVAQSVLSVIKKEDRK